MKFSAQVETIKIEVSELGMLPILLPRAGSFVRFASAQKRVSSAAVDANGNPAVLDENGNWPEGTRWLAQPISPGVIFISIREDDRVSAREPSEVPSRDATPVLFKKEAIFRIPSHRQLYFSAKCDVINSAAVLFVSVGD